MECIRDTVQILNVGGRRALRHQQPLDVRAPARRRAPQHLARHAGPVPIRRRRQQSGLGERRNPPGNDVRGRLEARAADPLTTLITSVAVRARSLATPSTAKSSPLLGDNKSFACMESSSPRWLFVSISLGA